MARSNSMATREKIAQQFRNPVRKKDDDDLIMNHHLALLFLLVPAAWCFLCLVVGSR